MRRVAITGVGAVSPAGTTLAATWDAVRAGRDALRPPSRMRGNNSGVRLVAEIPDFDPTSYFERQRLPSLDPVSQYAIVAAREAVAQSGVDLAAAPERVQCVIGSGVGGETTHDECSELVYSRRANRLHPLTVPRVMTSAVASQVAMEFGIKGGVFVTASACASAAHALGLAFHAIRSGSADTALAGGSEACLTFSCLKAWEALHVLSDEACRPFSKGRRGLVLGEGAAVFVLEDWDAARARGADVLAEFVGFGMSSDAGSLTSPEVDGMARAMRSAIADACTTPDRIDHVNAHGTGTRLNDSSECAALGVVFGAHAGRVPVTATKSVLGHGLGASGALEFAVAVTTLREQVLPPTANFTEADPECPIDCVPNTARDARVEQVLSNSFAFGGLNASLVARRA